MNKRFEKQRYAGWQKEQALGNTKQDNQTDSEYNYLTGQIHIKKESKPLCNQDGVLLNLCVIEDFQKVPPVNRCGRCQRLIDIKDPWDDPYSLRYSEKQRVIKITGALQRS